jgi:hypothetical protein
MEKEKKKKKLFAILYSYVVFLFSSLDGKEKKRFFDAYKSVVSIHIDRGDSLQQISVNFIIVLMCKEANNISVIDTKENLKEIERTKKMDITQYRHIRLRKYLIK